VVVVAFDFGVPVWWWWWCIRQVHNPWHLHARRRGAALFPILTRQQLLENLVTLLNLSKLVTIPSCFCSSLVPEPVEHADHVLKIMCTCPPSQCLNWASTRAKRDICSSKSPPRSRAAVHLAQLHTPLAKAVSSWILPAYRRSAPTLTV
jgi:hypothetical protein